MEGLEMNETVRKDCEMIRKEWRQAKDFLERIGAIKNHDMHQSMYTGTNREHLQGTRNPCRKIKRSS